MRSRRVLGLACLLAILSPVAASARPVDCRPPVIDPLLKAICPNAERRADEKRLSDTVDALRLLADASRRDALDAAQSAWESERRVACTSLPDYEIRTCHYQRTGLRLQELEAELAHAQHSEMLTLANRSLELKGAMRVDPVTLVTQLRYRGRILAETLGRDGFDEVARHGDAHREAVVIRGRHDGAVYAVTASAGAPPEIWRFRSSFPLEPALTIESSRAGLLIAEAPVPNVGRTAALWTPTDGWQMTSRPHVPERSPQPDTLNTADTGSDTLISRKHIALGPRQLELLTYFGSRQVLAFDDRMIAQSGPLPFDIDAPEAVGDTKVLFVVAHNAGNAGCVAQYLVADTPGRSLRRWELDLCYLLARQRTSDGYILLNHATPGADGIRYHWTPSGGLNVESYIPFHPQAGTRVTDLGDGCCSGTIWFAAQNEELFRGLAAAAGPSFPALAQQFDRVHKIDSPSGMRLFSDCGGGRFCGPEVSSIVAWHQESGKLYFALAPPRSHGHRPFGTPDPEAALVRPIEYHPPIELWPDEVREAVSSALP